MKTKCLNVLGLMALLLPLTACGSSSSEAPTDVPDKACYDRGCANIIDARRIVDPRRQYAYPDERSFPRAAQRVQYRAPYAFLDLSQVNGNFALSKNLRLLDFAIPQKGRYGLVQPGLVKKVQSIIDHLGTGLIITSGYRSPGYNADTDGSATWSRHTYGDGVDLQHPKKSLKQIRAACVANKASFTLVYPKHIHCDWRNLPLDPAFYPPRHPLEPMQALENNRLAAAKESQIVYQKTNEGIRLATVIAIEDLEGVPTHEWVIHTPNGKVYEFFDSQFLFTPNEAGLYTVEVLVGDFFKIQSRFTW